MKCVEKRLDGELKYDGIIVKVRMDHAQLEDGRVVPREVVEHPGGVGILPVDDEGFCYMVRQFRYPFSRQLDELIPMGKCLTSPGISSETLYLYLARGLRAGDAHPDEGEFLNVEKYPLDELAAMAYGNELEDGKTQIAVLKAERLLKGR